MFEILVFSITYHDMDYRNMLKEEVMKLLGLDYWDDLEDGYIAHFHLNDDKNEYSKIARKFGGELDDTELFGFSLKFGAGLNDFEILTMDDGEVFYIDSNGYNNYIKRSKVSQDIFTNAKNFMVNKIMGSLRLNQ